MLVKHLALAAIITMLTTVTGLPSCSSFQEISSTSAPPFVFRSLELSQNKPGGEQLWELSSPEARYELSRRILRSRDPRGLLYSNGQPAYSISADSMTVVNDGELILLEGQVRIQQLGGRKILIRGGQLRWIPNEALMLIEQRPIVIDRLSRLMAKRTMFYPKQQELEFFGPTRMSHWTGNEPPDQNREPGTTIWASKGYWNISDGAIKAFGPIRVHRGGNGQDHLQWLKASRLSGNTIEGYIDLIAPVVAAIPALNSRLQAGTTRWWYQKERLTTEAPFVGKFGDVDVSGYGFYIKLGGNIATATAACSLQWPGELLQARFCRWNWLSGEILAKGDVELRRHNSDQISQAQWLKGSVGPKKHIQLSNPGGYVSSKLELDWETFPSRHQASPIQF